MMKQIEFILYIENQEESKNFYQALLNLKPSLDVPGMTEFNLSDNAKLGLMPNDGIAKIIKNSLAHPSTGHGIPRCELYLHVENAQTHIDKGLKLGATLIDPLAVRDWGDTVGYIADLDGHVIAFVECNLKE